DPGDPSYPAIEEDGEIMGVEEASLEDLIEKISGSFSSEQNGEMFENLAESIKDLKNIMDTISAQDEKIAEIVTNFDDFSRNLVAVTETLEAIVDKINVGSGTLSALLNDEQMRIELQETVSSIKQSAISLQDTLGPVEQMRFEWNYTGRYNSLQSVYRNDVGVLITPRKGKFYYLGVANLANSSEPTDNNPSNTMNKLEALLGYRFDKFEIYGGVMRAEGGLGVGYSFFEPTWAPKRTLQVHVNVYSMGRKVDDGKKTAPIVDADLRVGFLKWLYGGVLIEDAAYKAGVTPYIKIQLDDQDIARMLGIVGIAASAAK
ncbi:MAG: hypothetical protein LBB93_02635, partial [Elusimicrobiota bacterium]|nr:hypothetical protein [Elusimicrobiota bacterium]